MPTYKGKVEKTMEAKSIGLLNHMLQMALGRAREENNFDIIMFMGVDGRIFASSIPSFLNADQYHLLNLVKGNLPHICNQLAGQNLMLSIQQYQVGTVIISGVGDKAFLVFLTTKPLEVPRMEDKLRKVLNASIVMKHIFELKPVTAETLALYDEDIAGELKKLTRLLFVEMFDQTREYRKNMEVLNYLRPRIRDVVGVGLVDEIVSMAFNEIGTSAPYMTDAQWDQFLLKVVEEIRKNSGDVVADRCAKAWAPAVRKVLKSFV